MSVFKYVEQLAEQGYPYDMTYLRYNIGSDNGPPDPELADAVRAWNERYVSPRLVISNVTDVFKKFEERYGDTLPVQRGDLTGHWEDGAASSARETALVRRAAEELNQTEALSAVLRLKAKPCMVTQRLHRMPRAQIFRSGPASSGPIHTPVRPATRLPWRPYSAQVRMTASSN